METVIGLYKTECIRTDGVKILRPLQPGPAPAVEGALPSGLRLFKGLPVVIAHLTGKGVKCHLREVRTQAFRWLLF